MSPSISTTELQALLENPNLRLFDCRFDLMDKTKGAALFAAAHLPNAQYAHLESALSGEKTGSNGRHPLPSPAAFIAYLESCGVSEDSLIVAYDDVGGQFASRLWWLCKWVGLKNVALLDGGIGAWMREERSLVSTTVNYPRTALALRANPLMHLSANEVLARLNTPDMLLIDARAAERFRGEVEPIDPVAGHIPGAANRFYKTNLDANLMLRPSAELHAEFIALMAQQGVTRASQVVHQCGSGVTACANIFAMEAAGLPGAVLYGGSWSEWIADTSRPIVGAVQ
jgi:thiosulfate/3-mercaptopyruvate sulfurtransferase